MALSSLGPPIPLRRQRMDGRRDPEAGRRGTCGWRGCVTSGKDPPSLSLSSHWVSRLAWSLDKE